MTLGKQLQLKGKHDSAFSPWKTGLFVNLTCFYIYSEKHTCWHLYFINWFFFLLEGFVEVALNDVYKQILTFVYSILFYSFYAFRRPLIFKAHLQLDSCFPYLLVIYQYPFMVGPSLSNSLSVWWRTCPHSCLWSSKLEWDIVFPRTIISEWFLYFSILSLFYRDYYFIWFFFLELPLAQTVSPNQSV